MKQSKILYSSLFSNLLISGSFPLKYVTVGDIFFLAENKFSCLLLWNFRYASTFFFKDDPKSTTNRKLFGNE